MKKTSLILVTLLFTFGLLAGCGSNGQGGETQGEAPSGGEQKKETIELKLGTIRVETDPTTVAAQKFAELVKEKTNGEIEISVFPNSTIGGILDMFTGMQSGTVDMMYEGISSYGWLDGAKSFNIMSFPFFWESYEVMFNVMETEEFRKMFEEAAKATGVRVIKAIGDTEARQLSANKPVANADDFQGLKIRTAESKIVQETMKALGAQPVVIPFADLYVALRQGTADAQENGFITIQNSSFYEVQKYLMRTDYIRDVKSWYISENVWQSLSDEHKQAMLEAAEEAGNLQTELARKQIEESLEFLKTKMEYIEPDLDSIRVKLEPTFQQFDGDLWPAGLLDKVKQLKEQAK